MLLKYGIKDWVEILETVYIYMRDACDRNWRPSGHGCHCRRCSHSWSKEVQPWPSATTTGVCKTGFCPTAWQIGSYRLAPVVLLTLWCSSAIRLMLCLHFSVWHFWNSTVHSWRAHASWMCRIQCSREVRSSKLKKAMCVLSWSAGTLSSSSWVRWSLVVTVDQCDFLGFGHCS